MKVKKQDLPIILIALGGNAGSQLSDRVDVLSRSIGCISDEIGPVRQISQFYRTPSFPAGSGPEFVNAVIRIESATPAPDVLSGLHQIEQQFGRVRTVRWGQRTLDLDLLAYGDLVLPDRLIWRQWHDLSLDQQIKTAPDQLILPHPRLQDRAFVLVPLAEILPDWRHPELGQTATQMRDALPKADLDTVQAINLAQI